MSAKEKKKKWKRLSEILKFTAPTCGLMMVIRKEICLDVVKLDDMVKCPDGISLNDYITEKYGEEAAQLVGDLI